ncbi:aldehyde-activating protein [Aureimonas endophytica]|uniref:Aldehyde-activating protein n=1 Tax=Aureimonas endophytica TaxID=2027858 RepID=A0A917E676_9HYPH|nr:GFA family protein [Aureimonas endophytica]GGE06999.1 aldehyde-activating protein [Aureimonas endophytica]
MDLDIHEAEGGCHCGTVRFRAVLPEGLRRPRRCNCSLCRMRGAVVVTGRLDGFTLLEGAEALALYQFNTRVAKHYFCSRCGIYTHHQRRSNPAQLGINVACLDGVSPFDFAEVPVNEGVRHPSDAVPGEARRDLAGLLRFEPFD